MIATFAGKIVRVFSFVYVEVYSLINAVWSRDGVQKVKHYLPFDPPLFLTITKCYQCANMLETLGLGCDLIVAKLSPVCSANGLRRSTHLDFWVIRFSIVNDKQGYKQVGYSSGPYRIQKT